MKARIHPHIWVEDFLFSLARERPSISMGCGPLGKTVQAGCAKTPGCGGGLQTLAAEPLSPKVLSPRSPKEVLKRLGDSASPRKLARKLGDALEALSPRSAARRRKKADKADQSQSFVPHNPFDPEQQEFEVRITMNDGKIVTSMQRQSNKVAGLKVAISEQTGIPLAELENTPLYCYSQQMSDTFRLQDYDIPWNGTDVTMEGLLGPWAK